MSTGERVSTGMVGRAYLDPGDRLSGHRDPAEVVTVLQRWGPGGGPRNVLVERRDGTRQARAEAERDPRPALACAELDRQYEAALRLVPSGPEDEL